MYAASIQDLDTSREMVGRLGVDIPILADTSRQVARDFGIFNLPGSMGAFSTHSFWVIDRAGKVRFREVSLEMHVPLERVRRAATEVALGVGSRPGG